MAELSMKNVGPIVDTSIPIPVEGGVVVLKGRNGSGKSTALEAARSLVRGSGKLSVRQGSVRGEVEGWGARISVGRSTRRVGELDVVHLEGRLSIDQLVDPGQKDPAAADTRRIKALLALTGAKANPADYYDLVGGVEEFDSLLAVDEAVTDDPIELAAKVKRKLEARARDDEQQIVRLRSQMEARRSAAGDGETASEEDYQATMQATADAGVSLQLAREELRKALHQQTRLKEIQTRRESLAPSPATKTVDELQAAISGAITTIEELAQEHTRLEQEISKLKAESQAVSHEADKAMIQLNHLQDQLNERVATEKLVASLEEKVKTLAPNVDAARQGVLDGEQAVREAEERLRVATEGRARGRLLAEAEATEKELRQVERKAEHWRDLAGAVDNVLSQLVQCPELRVEGGRLLTNTDRGPTFFDELSTGERWRLAIQIAARSVGSHGLIVIDQEGWEALDPSNRLVVAEEARVQRVVILTAEPADGDLRAELFDGRAA